MIEFKFMKAVKESINQFFEKLLTLISDGIPVDILKIDAYCNTSIAYLKLKKKKKYSRSAL